MTDDGKKKGFSEDLVELQQQYAGSVMGRVTECFDEIEKALSMKVPLDLITEKLNHRFGLTTQPKTVSQCLYRIRTQRKAQSLPSTSTKTKNSHKPKSGSEPESSTILNLGDVEAQDDWNDTEHLVGYRLEDCIRPYVSVVDGKIEKHFPKGTILRLDMRNALKRLQNKVHPS